MVSRADIQTMLGFQLQKKMLGCAEDTACMAEIGGALGADYILSGQVSEFGKRYRLALTLQDVKKGKVVSRLGIFCDRSEDALAVATQQAVSNIFRELEWGGELPPPPVLKPAASSAPAPSPSRLRVAGMVVGGIGIAGLVAGAVTQPCTPFICGTTACKTSCTGDLDCITSDYCVAPSCVPKKASGVSCASANDCTSGNCVDGVCCGATAASCKGCNACNVPGKLGTCWPVAAGSDPHDACTTASCQTTCDGAGACGTITLGLNVICASASCVNGAPDAFGRPTTTTASVARCGGYTQTCPGLTSGSSCGEYTCSGSYCATPCANNDGCISNTLCVAGACQYCATDADCGNSAPICSGGFCQCSAGDPGCTDSSCSGPEDCSSGGWGDTCPGPYGWCSCTPGVTKCNGRAPQCNFGSCGACGPLSSNMICLVGQLCTTADATGTCKAAPAFHCSTGSDCASGTCTGGFCTTLPAGKPCTRGADCTSGTCNASWLCN